MKAGFSGARYISVASGKMFVRGKLVGVAPDLTREEEENAIRATANFVKLMRKV